MQSLQMKDIRVGFGGLELVDGKNPSQSYLLMDGTLFIHKVVLLLFCMPVICTFYQ